MESQSVIREANKAGENFAAKRIENEEHVHDLIDLRESSSEKDASV